MYSKNLLISFPHSAELHHSEWPPSSTVQSLQGIQSTQPDLRRVDQTHSEAFQRSEFALWVLLKQISLYISIFPSNNFFNFLIKLVIPLIFLEILLNNHSHNNGKNNNELIYINKKL